MAKIAARERRRAIEWLADNPRWWEYDCSYPWCDIPMLISIGALSVDEVIGPTDFDMPAPASLRRCIEGNVSLHGGPWDGSLARRAGRLANYR